MLSQIFQSIFVYIRLCFIKDTPASLPFSNIILILVVLLDVLLRVISFETTAKISTGEVVFASVLSLVFLLMTLFFLVYYVKKQTRWHKLASALIGVEVLLFCILHPLISLLPNGQMPFSVALLVMIWTMVIKGNILRKALDFRLLNSVMLILAIEIISYIPFMFLVTEATAQ